MIMAAALGLAGCGEQNAVVVNNTTPDKQVTQPTTKTADASMTVTDNKTTESVALAPFFQTTDIVYNAPKALDTQAVLAPYKGDMQTLNENAVKAYQGAPAKWEDLSSLYHFYDSGTIKKAPYDGWKLVVLNMDCDGPCFSANLFRFAWDPNGKKLVELEKMSSSEYAPDEMAALTNNSDKNFVISGLIPPQAILFPDGINSIDLAYRDMDFYGLINKNPDQGTTMVPGYSFMDLGKVAFVDPKIGNVYYSSELVGALFVKLPDGSVSNYSYDPKLLDTKYYQTINWKDKSEPISVADNYSEMQHGCGVGGNGYFVEDITKDSLVEAGKTSKGTILYSAKITGRLTADKDKNYSENADKAELALNQAYDSYADMEVFKTQPDNKGPALTYQQFLAEHPILYWQDPLGRFSAIIRNDVKPQAECGKPVVYLYPQKTMDVSVKVNEVQLTKTVPEYGNGWNVKASPNGEIYNYADGQKYPYLFWEGKKNGGINVNSGTVVVKADLEKFLRVSLVKLGLNESEGREFMAFWLPKMQAVEQPYIFVSFAGTEEFNKVAPLDIQPKPDTLIRVFMYYMPMNSRVSVPAQQLSSKPRRGFTVVEWGGTSSDGWQTR